MAICFFYSFLMFLEKMLQKISIFKHLFAFFALEHFMFTLTFMIQQFYKVISYKFTIVMPTYTLFKQFNQSLSSHIIKNSVTFFTIRTLLIFFIAVLAQRRIAAICSIQFIIYLVAYSAHNFPSNILLIQPLLLKCYFKNILIITQ
ncbi:transmembrane protein, putative (macronuclear) [Tetrahymena thermophila SB210]|uniref:Transmembrane protein, putative n=1 Tax=Tetrahymena thermophila (strain SB210) TaxID=312017 RepID=W7X5D0_TETTS|nr:transmembrane protein, putative [Tetrahymena thermophila SB210]EWS71563.1 transmembrane protein, putative [Tetrahymena thermophila SB210]|eukprot:XP_012655908.1 transmembrane protein, putative [Tetrahymena thermophila SB210]